MNQCSKSIKKMKQRDKSDSYCYRKVGRAITIWGAKEKIQYCYCNIVTMNGLTLTKIFFNILWAIIIFLSTVSAETKNICKKK